MTNAEKASVLQEVADDDLLVYLVGRRAVEDVLVKLRDGRISTPSHNNGLVIRERDGRSSDVIRLAVDEAVRIAMKAMAKHLAETEQEPANA